MSALCDEFDPNATEIEHGIARVIERTRALRAGRAPRPPETVALAHAPGRVLAQSIRAALDVPMTDISAMDGYGLPPVAEGTERARFQLVGTAAAGRPYDGRVESGQAVRILTGAVIPDGVDRVVVEEIVRVAGTTLDAPIPKPGDNIRRAGEDTRAGDTLFAAGTRVSPLVVGVLASQGFTEVAVEPRITVGVLSTGDEVVESGAALARGQLYDSNRKLLGALLAREPGVALRDFGIVADDPARVEGALTEAGATCDLVIATGGASFGDYDYVNRLLAERGEVTFWKLAFKPGRPFACGRFGRAMFFGLPGNPVAVATTYALLVRPALDVLSGAEPRRPRGLRARLAVDAHKRAGRTDYQRAILERDDAADAPNAFKVTPITGQGSHQLHAMARANAYAILPRMAERLPAGSLIDVIPFDELGLIDA